MRTTWLSGVVFASVIIGLSMLGCAQMRSAGPPGDRPAWIDRPEASQNEGELVGVGSGSSRSQAIDAALARLAQSIEVRVVSIEKAVTVGGSLFNNDDGQTTSAGSSLHRAIQLLADQRLPGVRIRQTWSDQRRGETFALAALNVRAAGEWLDARVDEAVQRASQSLAHSESANGAWAKLKSLRAARDEINRALDAALARDAIDPAALSFNPVPDLRRQRQEIAAKLHDAQSVFRVEVIARTTQSEPIAAAVEQAIGADGWTAAVGRAPVKIVCDLTLARVVSYDPDARAIRWTAMVQAIDVQSRRVIDTLRLTGVELSREDASQAAAMSAVGRVQREIVGFLDRIFDND